ncbi:MAG: S8 family serine peptidase, partial [Gemmatimonadales bacterium]
ATPSVPFGQGSHNVQLIVTDDVGGSASDTVVVTVNQVFPNNQPPVANAGPDQTIVDIDGDGVAVVTFDGRASTDPDGTIVSYFWTKDGIPFNNAATFGINMFLGVHTVELTVTDDLGATGTDTVVMTVVAGDSPAPCGASSTQVTAQNYIVVLPESTRDHVTLAEDLARIHGVQIRHIYTHALKGFAFQGSEAAAQALALNPRVSYVEPDQIAWAIVQEFPTGVNRVDAELNATAKIDGIDGPDGSAERVNADIAIIDTGIDLTHPDLNVVMDQSFISSCGTGADDNGHGTHVAGTAAALDNDIGVVGVAPGARLWALKVLNSAGSGSFADIIAAIDFVTANADQIDAANMSLGCSTPCSSDALDTALANSVAAGVTYAVAAGNQSVDAGPFAIANHPDVITVSAIADFDGLPGGSASPTCRIDVDDTFADFSSFGDVVDIAAPGVCILSTWLNGGFNTISGTSMASPHVAGAAALVKADNPFFTPAQVKAELLALAIPQGDPNGFTGDPDGNPEPLLNVASGAPAPPNDPLPPTVDSFSATPTTITAGDLAILSWTTTGADADGVSIDNGVGDGLPAEGSRTVSPATTTTYALTATGAGGTATSSVTVTVSAPSEVATSTFSGRIGRNTTITQNVLIEAAGQVDATLSWTRSRASLNLTARDPSGATVASGSGSSPINVSFATTASGSYAFVIENTTRRRTDYTLSVTYPVGAPPPPPTLTAISVAPLNASIEEGQTQQFSATGTFSDGSTANLTASAAWSSSAPA